MSARLPDGLPFTGSPQAAAAYVEGVDLAVSGEAGAVEALARASALDPSAPLPHAAVGLLSALAGGPAAGTACLDRAGELAATLSEREHVRAARALAAGDVDTAVAVVAAEPRERLLLLALTLPLLLSGQDGPGRLTRLVDAARRAQPGWWYDGLWAFVLQEAGRFGEADELARAVHAVRPRNAHATHARAHVLDRQAPGPQALAWLDGWLAPARDEEILTGHLHWHAALLALEEGDVDDVLRRLAGPLAVSRLGVRRAVSDAASLLWRCRLRGVSVPDGVLDRDALAAAVDEVSRRPPNAFLAWCAGVALLALDDAAALGRLRDRVAADPRPGFPRAAAVVTALQDLAEGRFAAAASGLEGALVGLESLGGSNVQRDVLAQTRVAALALAGQDEAARSAVRALAEGPAPWVVTGAPATVGAVTPLR